MVEHRPYLLERDARKPLHKLAYVDSIFQVFEERGNRYARGTKQPGAAQVPWVTFDRWAGRPI